MDFGLAQPGDTLEPQRHPIQPPLYHAPEVLLGTGWIYKADIWNLGVMVRPTLYHMEWDCADSDKQIWNLMENEDLFKNIRCKRGTYNGRAHLADMIALLGPPPTALLVEEKRWREVNWSHGILTAEGKLCYTAYEYYGGPFFDTEGTINANLLHRAKQSKTLTSLLQMYSSTVN